MFLIKWLFRLIQLGLLLIVLLLVFPGPAARMLFSGWLRLALGAPVQVRDARVDLLGTSVYFRDIEIRNPYDFAQGRIAKIPHLMLDLEAGALLNRQIRFEVVELEIDRLDFLKDPEGRVNFFLMKPFKAGGVRPESGFPINRFVLTLRQGSFRDLQQKSGRGKEYELGLQDSEYWNVRRLADIVEISGWEALRRMRMEGLAGGLLDRIREELGDRSPLPAPRNISLSERFF